MPRHDLAHEDLRSSALAQKTSLRSAEANQFHSRMTRRGSLRAILGFTAFGVGAGEVLAAVQVAMIAGLP